MKVFYFYVFPLLLITLLLKPSYALQSKCRDVYLRDKIQNQKGIKEQILALITENGHITVQEIAMATELTIGAVNHSIGQLRKAKQLIRIDDHWETPEATAEPSNKFPEPMTQLLAGPPAQASTKPLDEPRPALQEEQKKQILALILTYENISVEEIAYMMDLPEEIIQQTIEKLSQEIQDTLKQIKRQILILVAGNKKITLSQITEKIKVPTLLIRKLIEQLEKDKKLLRQKGHWEIPKKNFKPLDELLTEPLVQPFARTSGPYLSHLIEKHKTEVLVLTLTRENISLEEIARIRNVSNKVVQEIIKQLRWDLQDTLKKIKEQILTLIAENNKISSSKIAEIIKAPRVLVRKLIQQLEEEQKLLGEEGNRVMP